jgi:hypothetical protein
MTGFEYPLPRVSPQGCIEGRSVPSLSSPASRGRIKEGAWNGWNDWNLLF